MQDTYETAAEGEADREQQKKLLGALNASDTALRRDECNAWCIRGKNGTIHSWGDGKTWVLFVGCRSEKHWTWVKRKLPFCTVVLDCEAEGTLRSRHLPTDAEATVIREELGIQKRREVSLAELERLRAYAFERKPRSGTSSQP